MIYINLNPGRLFCSAATQCDVLSRLASILLSALMQLVLGDREVIRPVKYLLQMSQRFPAWSSAGKKALNRLEQWLFYSHNTNQPMLAINNWRILLKQRFTANHMLLLMATITLMLVVLTTLSAYCKQKLEVVII